MILLLLVAKTAIRLLGPRVVGARMLHRIGRFRQGPEGGRLVSAAEIRLAAWIGRAGRLA